MPACRGRRDGGAKRLRVERAAVEQRRGVHGESAQLSRWLEPDPSPRGIERARQRIGVRHDEVESVEGREVAALEGGNRVRERELERLPLGGAEAAEIGLVHGERRLHAAQRGRPFGERVGGDG